MEFVNSNDLHNCRISDTNKEKFYIVTYPTNNENDIVNYFLLKFYLSKVFTLKISFPFDVKL